MQSREGYRSSFIKWERTRAMKRLTQIWHPLMMRSRNQRMMMKKIRMTKKEKMMTKRLRARTATEKKMSPIDRNLELASP